MVAANKLKTGSAVQTSLKIDKTQASQQLELLGYTREDKVYLTAFFPKGDSRVSQDKGRKSNRLNYQEVEGWQKEGRGVYFVVNGGGHKADEVTTCCAIFFEHDNLDKEHQLFLWETLGLPEPTFQVDTGGKSIHSYWVFDKPINPVDWKKLQTDLLEFADADRSLKNPNRVMRLAGAWHIKGDGSVNQTQIVSSSGKRYTYDQLREIIPTHTAPAPAEPARPYKPTHQIKSQLTNQWSDTDWAISYLNALSPARADNYQEWLGVGMALHSVDDCLLVEWDNWSRQSSKYKSGDCEKKWKSFKSQGVSIGSLAHLAKQDGWRSPFEKSSGRSFSGGIGSGGNKPPKVGGSGGSGSGDGGNGGGGSPLQMVSLHSRVKDILDRHLPSSKEKEALIYLAQAEGVTRADVEAIAKEINVESDRSADIEQESVQFKKLVGFRDKQLDLDVVFPHELARALKSKATSSRLDPIRLVQTLLPASGSVLGAKVRIIVKAGANSRNHWVEYPIFWTADISNPSSGKSDAERTIFAPLKELENRGYKLAEENEKKLPAIRAAWETLSKQERAEKQNTDADPDFFKSEYVDKVRRYIWDEITIEALFKLISQQPKNAGTAWIQDELEGLFAGLDQHKSGGKGNALQKLLTAWNSPLSGTVDRVDKNNSFRLSDQTLNISGGSQLSVVAQRMDVRNDPNGLTSRFLFAQPALPDDFAIWSDVQVDLFDAVKGLLEGLELMEGTVEFSTPAKDRWKRRWEEMRSGYLRYVETNAAYAYFLGKQCSYVPRLALLLHCIEHYYQPKTDFTQLSLETLEKAIIMSDYYCGQFRLVQASCPRQNNSPLEGLLYKVWEKVKALGEISASEVSQFARRYKWDGKKITAGVALEILTAINKTGYGYLKGKKLYLNPPDGLPPDKKENFDQFDQSLIIDQTTQSKKEWAFQEKFDQFDQTPTLSAATAPYDLKDSGTQHNGIQEELITLYTPPIDQIDQTICKTIEKTGLDDVDQVPNFDQNDQTICQTIEREVDDVDQVPNFDQKAQAVATPQVVESVQIESNLEAITPAQPQQTELSIYQRSDGTLQVDSSKLDDSFTLPVVAQENESSQFDLTTPAITSLEQLIDCLADVTTKEQFEAVTAGQSLEIIQDAIDLQNTPIQRQHLRKLMNLR